MNARERVMAAAAFGAVDRVPYDFFDEAGDLFTEGRYHPALRLGLSYAEQIDARVRWHRRFGTDLIFDAPVLVPPKGGYEARLTHDGREIEAQEPVYSSVFGLVWHPMPPKVQGPGLLPSGTAGAVHKQVIWADGTRTVEAIDLATGTTDVAEPAFSGDLNGLLAHIQCAEGDWERAEWSHLARMRDHVGPDVMLSGSPLDPFSTIGHYVGIENLMMLLLDEPDGVHEACDAFAGFGVRACEEMLAHGIDMIRLCAATACMLSPDMYRTFAFPYQKRMIEAVQARGGITHLHLCGNVRHLLDVVPDTGAPMLETITPPPLGDTTLVQAREAVGSRMALKGNMSPTGTLQSGTPEQAMDEARSILADMGGPRASGFLFSVADCMAPATPEANVQAVAEVLSG